MHLPSILDHYSAPARCDYVRHQGLIGGIGSAMEISQPPGAHGSPPTADLLLVQPQHPGIRLRKRWGDARFEGIAPAGSLWLVPPGAATDLEIRTRHVIRTIAVSAAYLAQAAPEHAPRLHRAQGPFHDPVVHHLLHATWHAATTPGETRLGLDALLHPLLAHLAEPMPTAPPPARLAPWQVRAVTEAIADSPASTLSLADLAARVQLSPFHFARAFRATLGVPPHRYQKQLRIQRAAALLAEGRLSVLQVALAVGYESSQALSRAFQQETGTTPAAWRARHRG